MGLTRPQLFLLVTIPLVLARIAVIASRGAFRRTPERMVAQWTDRLTNPPPSRLPKGLGPRSPPHPLTRRPRTLGPRSRRAAEPPPEGYLPAYPPIPPAPPEQAPQGQSPFDAQPPEEKDSRPGVGPGVATGCGLQVLAVILFFLTAGLIPTFFGALWPFILFTIGAALLMLSKRWRRFATGVLIVAAASWIVVIGPCIAIINGFSM